MKKRKCLQVIYHTISRFDVPRKKVCLPAPADALFCHNFPIYNRGRKICFPRASLSGWQPFFLQQPEKNCCELIYRFMACCFVCFCSYLDTKA